MGFQVESDEDIEKSLCEFEQRFWIRPQFADDIRDKINKENRSYNTVFILAADRLMVLCIVLALAANTNTSVAKFRK